VTPTSNTNTFDTTVALREAFALAKGVWGSQPTAVFWAGQRFYDRHDLHMSDFFYRDLSGFGGGLDDVQLGDTARLSVAWLGGSLNTLQSSGTPPPLRRRHPARDVVVTAGGQKAAETTTWPPL
jgi:maltoporin